MPPTDSDASSIRTLTDSLQRALYRHQGQRVFQDVNQVYIWPCDATATSLELLSALVLEKTYENGLHWEPSRNLASQLLNERPSRILDLGSGTTASWAVSMAERYPSAEVIGVDLVPTELSHLPPNITIEIHDLLEGLPYPAEFFSVIHCRFGGPSAYLFDNPNLDFLADVARALRPGGVFLLEEVDDMLSPFRSFRPNNPALPLVQARHGLRYVTRPPGTRSDWGEQMGRLVRESTRFETVLEASVDLPLGSRPNEGPKDRQRGTVHREAWLCAWEMQAAGLGMDDATIQELRRADEAAFPVEDVGLFVRAKIVWATKART